MIDTTLQTLSALFALMSGTGAGLLALLFWHVLRESPFGSVVAFLTGAMSAMIFYHLVLFVIEPDAILLDTLRSTLYTLIAIFLWLVIVTHQRIENSVIEG